MFSRGSYPDVTKVADLAGSVLNFGDGYYKIIINSN